MKLNLCCGMDYREGYINIDFFDKSSDGKPIKVDLKLDIRKGLPYEENSIDEIIFRESLEHFNRHDGIEILKEIYRILKPGGLLDLSVPPAEKQMRILLTMFNRDVVIDDFIFAHERFSPIKYLDDLCGATFKTYVDGKDLGQGASHKTFYSKKWISCIINYIGFNIEFIDEKIELRARK